MLAVLCWSNDLDEPGKQVKGAIRLKNTSRSHVAFKVLGYVKLGHSLLCFHLPICSQVFIDNNINKV